MCGKQSLLWLGCLCVLTFGCTGSTSTPPVEKLTPVAGKVTIDGKPAGGTFLSFRPNGATKGRGGSAITDAAGKYSAQNSEQKDGLVAGEYTVTFSRWLKPDGSSPPAGTPPANSGAIETISQLWNNPVKAGKHNTVTIPKAGSSSLNFDLPGKK